MRLGLSVVCKNWRYAIPADRLLTRAARQGVPSRDTQGVVYANFRKVVLAVTAAASLAAQTAPVSGGTSALDFEFFKTRVQPVFLAKRAGHARCYACHSTGTPYRLQRLSPGAATWNEEQSRKNFQATANMVNPGDVEASPLLIFPLAESAGGNHFHPGGKHWESKSAPEWQVLSEWAHGKKAKP